MPLRAACLSSVANLGNRAEERVSVHKVLVKIMLRVQLVVVRLHHGVQSFQFV